MFMKLVSETFKNVNKSKKHYNSFDYVQYLFLTRDLNRKKLKDLRCSKSVFELPWGKSVRQKLSSKQISLVFGHSCSGSVAGYVTDLLKVTRRPFLLPSSRCDTSFFIVSLKIVAAQVLSSLVAVEKNVVVKDTHGLDGFDCVFIILKKNNDFPQ